MITNVSTVSAKFAKQPAAIRKTFCMPLAQNGFTLIELVIVIVIVAILGAMSTKIITLPVKSYLDLARRTAMTDAADMSLRRMQRDVRRALPNSIRITGNSLEMLHTLDGGRYRARQDGSTAGCDATDDAKDILDFTYADDCFELMGALKSFVPTATNGEYLVIYNLGVSPASAYVGGNRTQVQNSSAANLLKFSAKQFPFSSPQQRFFIVDTPVTYRCDTSNADSRNNFLWRHSKYAIADPQVAIPIGGVADRQANYVSACSFTYLAGVATRAAQLIASITLKDNDSGESLTMVRQIHVDNVP